MMSWACGRMSIGRGVRGGSPGSPTRALIAGEYLLLPVARWFDRRAAPYHRAGIPLLEALFVPMAGAPAFGSVVLASDGEPSGPGPRPAAIRRRVGRAYRGGAFPGAASALAVELDTLAAAPQRDCLVRHLLESATVRRIAHITGAQTRGDRGARALMTSLLALNCPVGPGACATLMARRALHARRGNARQDLKRPSADGGPFTWIAGTTHSERGLTAA